jgi:hypothetical protein
VEGHGASLPSLIPRLAGRAPVHPMISMLNVTIDESMRSVAASIKRLLQDDVVMIVLYTICPLLHHASIALLMMYAIQQSVPHY